MQRPSYLLSFLTIQQLRLGVRFRERYGGAWLVWEPGAWQPPSREVVNTLGASGSTPATRPTPTDALCFWLAEEPGPIRVGRAPENDCVVSDATVSRLHFSLSSQGGTWRIDVASGRVVIVDGKHVTTAQPLAVGARLQVGNVTLSLQDERSLRVRTQG